MAQSEYNGRNRFDFEYFEAWVEHLPSAFADSFVGVEPSARGYALRPAVIAPRGFRFGVSRLITTMESGTITMIRRTISRTQWYLVLMASAVFMAIVVRWFDDLGAAAALWVPLVVTAFFTFLVISFWRQDLMFRIDAHNVTMRRGRGAEIARPTAEIQHCEYAWVHGEGESGSNYHIVVVFTDGQRFDTPQYVEILRAVHWFCPAVPLLDVPRSNQKFMPTNALRPSEPDEGRFWRWYQESLERRNKDLSSSE